MADIATPIENRASWRTHRAAADAVRSRGGHFTCAQLLGFLAVDGEIPAELGKPCGQCRGIYEAATKTEENAA